MHHVEKIIAARDFKVGELDPYFAKSAIALGDRKDGEFFVSIKLKSFFKKIENFD